MIRVAPVLGLMLLAASLLGVEVGWLDERPPAELALLALDRDSVKLPTGRVPYAVLDYLAWGPTAPQGPVQVGIYRGNWPRFPAVGDLQPTILGHANSFNFSSLIGRTPCFARFARRLYLTAGAAYQLSADTDVQVRCYLDGALLELAADLLPERHYAFVSENASAWLTVDCLVPEGGHQLRLAIAGPGQPPEELTPAILGPPPTWQLALRDGSRLTGQVLAWADGTLQLGLSSADGQDSNETLRIPQTALAMISRTAETAAPAPAISEDVVTVGGPAGQQRVSGDCLGLADLSLRFRYAGAERRIDWQRVESVLLRAAPAPRMPRQYQQLQTRSGAVIYGHCLGWRESRLQFGLLAGGDLSWPAHELGRITFLGGHRAFLSELEPEEFKHTPYFDLQWPYRRDQDFTGQPLKLADREFARGLALHAQSSLRYQLAGAFDYFRALVGFEQPGGSKGCADLQVLGDDRPLWSWRQASGETPPKPIYVDIRGIKMLTLSVGFGPDADIGDRVLWADAQVLRRPPVQRSNGGRE